MRAAKGGRVLGSLRRVLTREALRHAIASVIATALAIVVVVAEGRSGVRIAGEAEGSLLVTLLFGLYGPVFLLLTWKTFRRHRGDRLRERLRRSGEGSRVVRFLFLSSPASWAGTVLAVGVASVALLATGSGPVDIWVIPICVIGVAGSWVLMVAVMAVEYMRSWANEESMTFPGTEPRGFVDFLYLSVQLSTTFSSADVQLTRGGVRGLASLHSVLAFAYSTAVIAVFASLLITLDP